MQDSVRLVRLDYSTIQGGLRMTNEFPSEWLVRVWAPVLRRKPTKSLMLYGNIMQDNTVIALQTLEY